MFTLNKYKPSVYLNFYLKDDLKNQNIIKKSLNKNYYNYVFKHKNIFIRDFLYIYYIMLVHSPFSLIDYKNNVKNIFKFKFYCLLV